MKIQVVRQKRKTICLKMIDKNNAVLKVPTSYSDKKVKEFLNSKQTWLEKTQRKLDEREKTANLFDLKNFVYFGAKPIMKTSELAIDFESLDAQKREKIIKKAYCDLFTRLEEKAEEWSKKTGLIYAELKCVDSARIWGSLNELGVMKLNYKLSILPERLIDYVIVHELCHTRHLNHSPMFWENVKLILPDWKKRRDELKNYAFLLKKGIF